MRLKAKTVLKTKSRISLNEALHLSWPRSNTERLLGELMKQGVCSYFFAILYTLICTAQVKQNYLLNSIVYLQMDSEILLEIFNDIFQAGAFILMNTFNYIDYKSRETSLRKSESHMEDNIGINKFVLFNDSFSYDNQCQSLNYAFIFITLSFNFDQQDVFILIANRYLFVSELLHDNSQFLNRLTVKLLILFNSFVKSLTLVMKESFPDNTWLVYLKDISILMTKFTSLKLNQQIKRILADVVLTIWSNIFKYLSTINNYKKIDDLGGYSFQDFSYILDNLTDLIFAIHFIRIDPVIFQVIIIKNIILKENLNYSCNFQEPNAFNTLLKCQNVLMKAIQQVSHLIVVYSESHSLTLPEYFVENLYVEIVCLYIRISIRLTLLFNYRRYYVFANYRTGKSSSFLKIHFPTLIPLYNTLAFDKLFSYFFKIQLIAVLNENYSAHFTQNFIIDLCGTLSPLGIKNSDAFIHFPTFKNMCDLLQTPPTILCYTSNTICIPPILDLNIDHNGIDIYWWSLFANNVTETELTETNPLTGFKRIGFLTPYKKPLILSMSIIQPGSYLFAVAYFDLHGKQISCLSRSTKSIYIGFNVSYKIVFEKSFILVNPDSSNFNSLDVLWPHIVEYQVDKQLFDSITYPIKEQNICSYSTPLLSKIILAMLIKLAFPYFNSENSLIMISLRDNTSFPNSDFVIKLFSLHKLVLMLNDSNFIFKYFLLVYTTIIPFLQNFQFVKSLLPSLIIIFNTTLKCFAPCRILCSNESYFKILISFSYSLIKKFDFIDEHNLSKFFFEFISQNVTQHFSDASFLAHSNSNIPESFVSIQIEHRDLISRSKCRTSGHCLGNAVSSLKLKAKKQKNYIPAQMIKEKFNSLVAFETFFFIMHSSICSLDSLEITGNEDPFILNLLIATLQPTIAYKEVSKFRRRSKYIEYITKLCIKTYISGKLDLILTWSEEVFNWLQKRNELLLTKVPLIYIQRDKISNSSMDYVLTNNYFKDYIKDGSILSNVHNINLSLNPLTEDESFLKIGNKDFNTEKRGHSFKKVTNRLPRLQIRKDDVYSKARDILSTLVPSLWKSHCKRKRIRKITFAELPWRIELFNILSATRFELLLKCLKQNYHIKKDILFSYFTYSSPKRLSNIVNGKILFGCDVCSVRDIHLSNIESAQGPSVDGTFSTFTLNNIISEFPEDISDETKQLLVNLSN